MQQNEIIFTILIFFKREFRFQTLHSNTWFKSGFSKKKDLKNPTQNKYSRFPTLLTVLTSHI